MAIAGFLVIVFVPASGNDPEHALLALTVMLWALFADFAIDRFADPPEPAGTGLLARLRFRLARLALYGTALLAMVLLVLIAGLTVRAARVLLGI
ncbi:MAG: hypothetical protein HKO62_12490 [Gammaproteobacteria bacterium]|nr:hypothetical protein [Gammaproteobacteria bacterium]NNM01563.1 hypothetical protein [Gammaproteobacteria bacterium]